MFRIVTLVAFVIGFFFLGPKVLAEFGGAPKAKRRPLAKKAKRRSPPKIGSSTQSRKARAA
jgi:hypothetical protein